MFIVWSNDYYFYSNLTRGILTSFRFGGLPGGGVILTPLPIFYLWTDFDDFFFWVLLITSTLQNISHFFSMTTMTSDMDIFRLPVYRKITFFLVFGSQLFCSTFAQHFFGLKLTPEIIVIEIIYHHVREKSISLSKNVIYDVIWRHQNKKKITKNRVLDGFG